MKRLRAAIAALHVGALMVAIGSHGVFSGWGSPWALAALWAGVFLVPVAGLWAVVLIGLEHIRRLLWYGSLRAEEEGRKHETFKREE